MTMKSVSERYGAAARKREEALCCPVTYDAKYLAAIPPAVIERDYGCGDPTRYVRPGDRVLDLGSGSGKVCFIAAQIAGPEGQVIGIDENEEMLSLARGAASAVAERIGFDRVEFRRGHIQDLRTDLEGKRPVLVADDSVDVVLSNCVLNLVDDAAKTGLFREIHRVLAPRGRLAVSDIVAGREVPSEMKRDPELWSGCISGAMTEAGFLAACEAAGFLGLQIAGRSEIPWRVVEGIEFRSITVTGVKTENGECITRGDAVLYPGPFREVQDDEGHRFVRGVRTEVCEKTFRLLTSPPYQGLVCAIPADPAAAAAQGQDDAGCCGGGKKCC